MLLTGWPTRGVQGLKSGTVVARITPAEGSQAPQKNGPNREIYGLASPLRWKWPVQKSRCVSDFKRMIETSINQNEQQKLVGAHFHSHALTWKSIYDREGVYETIHQQRRARVLALIDDLALPPASPVLEVGCGAGSIAVALAQRRYLVQATDFVPAMVALARQLATESGVENRVTTRVADIRHLEFPDNSFSLVVAMGVLPWVQPMDKAVREMARVLKPGGRLIVNSDNRWRLNHLLVPFVWVRPLLGRAIRRLGFRRASQGACSHTCSNRRFDEMLRSAGLVKLRDFNLGFGPFTLFTMKAVPEQIGVKLHSKLQSLADRGFPLLRQCGSQYVVLAKKL